MQGCPLSPYLFILTGEVLAKAGRKNENIRGINVNDKEIEISQYADDSAERGGKQVTIINKRNVKCIVLSPLIDFFLNHN